MTILSSLIFPPPPPGPPPQAASSVPAAVSATALPRTFIGPSSRTCRTGRCACSDPEVLEELALPLPDLGVVHGPGDAPLGQEVVAVGDRRGEGDVLLDEQ